MRFAGQEHQALWQPEAQRHHRDCKGDGAQVVCEGTVRDMQGDIGDLRISGVHSGGGSSKRDDHKGALAH